MAKFIDRFAYVFARSDQEVLEVTGTLLVGTRWISPLSRAIPVSQPYISQVYAAQRALTVEQRKRLAELVSQWVDSLARKRSVAAELEAYWRETAASNYRPRNIKRET